ncbi:MAG: hypothetical protein V4487_08430 [Chlamydiota bacterium]
MGSIIGKKEEKMAIALNNKWERYNPILIGGDLFTTGYLAFEGVQAIVPSLAAIGAISIATLVCGEIAGAINIGVAYQSGKECIQAFKNGDKLLGSRLFLDCIFLIGIGLVMILASLALKVTALAGVGLFFSANPWFLPLLFFIITLPLLSEIGIRIKNIATHQDLASKLRLDAVQKHLTSPQINWEQLFAEWNDPNDLDIFNESDTEQQIGEKISSRMEKFQADMGVSAAVEALKLQHMLMKKDRNRALEQLEKVKKEITDWNRAQYVRLFQQCLYIFSFVLSMAGIPLKSIGNTLNATQDFSMAAANGIPLYMDTFWAFKRNTPMVVPKVELCG